MPEQIPILYTGLNAAKPDWKSFNANFQARMSQIQARNKQQRQFDILEQDKLRKEFMDSVNVDDINSTNELLLAKKYELTKGVEDYMTKTLTENGGKIDGKNILEARMLTNRVNQDIAKINSWSKNQATDIATVKDHPEWFDQDKVKANILNWNPDKDGGYNKSKLENSFKEIPIGQVIEGIRADVTNSNTASVISEIGGIKITRKEDWNDAYEERDPNTGAYLGSKDAGQINFVVTDTSKGDGAFLTQQSIDRNWNNLKDDVAKQSYENRAVKAGYKPEYGKFLYLIDQGKLFDKNRDITTKTSTSPIKEDTTKDRPRNNSGDIVDLLTTPRSLSVAGKEYDTVYSMPKAVNIPSFTLQGVQKVVDGKLIDVPNGVYKGKLTDVVTENGKMTKFKIEVPSDKMKTDSEGKQVYMLNNIQGTQEDILAQAKDKGLSWDAGYISRNAEPIKETNKTQTLLVNASKNKSLGELFRIKGINEYGESQANKKVELTEGSLDEL